MSRAGRRQLLRPILARHTLRQPIAKTVSAIAKASGTAKALAKSTKIRSAVGTCLIGTTAPS